MVRIGGMLGIHRIYRHPLVQGGKILWSQRISGWRYNAPEVGQHILWIGKDSPCAVPEILTIAETTGTVEIDAGGLITCHFGELVNFAKRIIVRSAVTIKITDCVKLCAAFQHLADNPVCLALVRQEQVVVPRIRQSSHIAVFH